MMSFTNYQTSMNTQSESPIIIKHEWRLEKGNSMLRPSVPMYSSYFSTDHLPGVSFRVLAGFVHTNNIVVYVSKEHWRKASVVIRILVNRKEERRVKIENWQCSVYDIPVQFPEYDDGYGSVSAACEIWWYGFAEEHPTAPLGLYQFTQDLLTSSNFADITIIIDEIKLPAHKLILAVQSPVFAAMFHANMRETKTDEVVITDIDIDDMKEVLKFLYTGMLDSKLNVDCLLAIMATAEKYQMAALKIACQNNISKKMTIDTVLRVLEAANLYDVPQLTEKAITYIMIHRDRIAKMKEFEQLYLKHPNLFFDFVIRLIAKCG